MKLSELTTVEQLDAFLRGSQPCAYTVHSSKDECYQWIQGTLVQFRYMTLRKADKGIVIRYLMKISGYSRQQLTRLIRQYVKRGKIVRTQQTCKGFARRYTAEDIRLLAELDELHQTPNGAMIKKLCERAYRLFVDADYERLSCISVSHIYNLRHGKAYQQHRHFFTKTQSYPSSIGERRKPTPNGLPGYIRVDTVHQGDQDKVKGVYHINVVDEVTQFQITCCVEKISERYLVPALASMLDTLPFEIRGFHSDNGSEYINRNVSSLLEKLRVEFTKSRSRKSNDNALAEGKNAAIIRKHFGYSHIPQHWATAINDEVQEPLYRYINFHRPCFFPVVEVNEKGKETKKYPYKNMMTPYEKFVSLPDIANHLKPGVTLESLHEIATEMSDNDAAKRLQNAKKSVFSKIFAPQATSA